MLVIQAKSSREINRDNEFSNIRSLLGVFVQCGECGAGQQAPCQAVRVVYSLPGCGLIWVIGGGYGKVLVEINHL
ncbi:MAG: hypothetical protein P8011_06455 [Acidihalobacter sp.]|uniref:hypothetical protein n=1 Tax=Acidihalobacter sp. TaxID=1872108 RepID=UPI00307CFA6C